MKRTFALLLLSLAASATLRAQAPEFRQWTNKASGKQIEAKMVSADPKERTVTIEMKDGKTFNFKVDVLVDADLAYIKQRLTAPQSAPPAPAPAPAPAGKAPATQPPAAPAAPVAKAPAAPVGQPAPAAPTLKLVSAKKFKFPNGGEVLKGVKKERPRLLLNAAGMAALKGRLEGDAITKGLFDSLKATAEKVIELPELVQIRGEAARGASIGGKAIFRTTGLGILNYVDGDPRWKDYAVREMTSIASFTNWHFEEVHALSEFVWGMSIGYDMFRKSMTAKEEAKIKAGLIDLGIEPLICLFKGDPFPATAKRAESGAAANTKPTPNKHRAIAETKEPDSDEMVAACVLLMSAIAINDEDPTKAGHAATLACKVINEGIKRFGADGIWEEGITPGDEVLDALASLIMTLRAATGSDFGLTTIEGLANAGTARMHLSGPAGAFNYGDAQGTTLNRTWVTSFLASVYGNPGVPAVKPPKGAQNTEAQNMGLAGQLLYHSAFMSGYGTPSSLDAQFPTSQLATLRSAWNDPAAYYVAIKGGDNSNSGGQLDLGTFVLDAGGVRWAVDLGAENDRAMPNGNDHNKLKNYRENTLGQNTWRFVAVKNNDDYKYVAAKKGYGDPPKGSQPLNAKAPIVGFASTPERGVAVVDLTDAYSAHAKDFHRGVMINRGATPNVVIQDEMKLKSGDPTWVMHTRAEVTAEGNKATLKSGGKTLTMAVLAPAGATIVAEDPPDQKEPLTSLKGVKVIKIALPAAKGQQATLSIGFALGETAPSVPVTPIAQWTAVKKK